MNETKRQSILAAATNQFSEIGFKKTSISNIAHQAGVAKGTVYLACESKTDLFYQVVMVDLRKWIATVAAIIDPREPADEILMTLARRSLVFFAEFPLVKDLFIGLFHREHPLWATKFEALRTLGRANITEILQLGIRQGRFRSDLPVEETAMLLQDLQLTTLVMGERGMGIEQRQNRLELGFALLFKGLRVPGNTTP